MTPDAEYFHNQPDIVEQRLSAYLDDMLDADERAQLEAHLAGCDTCQQQLAELRRVRALLRALPQPALPRSFLLPVEEASAPATSAESPTTPIPMRPPVRRQRAARITRAAQWLGAIAAVLGLALLVSTAVLGTRGVTETTSSAAPNSGGATSAHSPTFSDQQGASPQMRSPTATPLPRATAADTATGNNAGKSPEAARGSAGPSQSHSSLLDLQVGGGVLLVAGVALVVVSSVARRRRLLRE